MGVQVLIDLKGHTALVTGGDRSVGKGIAEILASAGAFVHVNDLHAERAEEVAASIEAAGGSGRPWIFDVTDAAAVNEAFSAIESAGAPVDILVNNAGVAEGSTTTLFSASGPEDWLPAINLNLVGSMNMIRRALPGMIVGSWGASSRSHPAPVRSAFRSG
jgi:3-oxoacyl-[acyl-carrier protein] reductase